MIGGVSYILFAFVPMFIVASAVVVMGDGAMELAKNDYQRVLPTFVMTQDAAGDADPVLRRAAVGHQEHVVGDAAGAVDQLRREHPEEPAPGHDRPQQLLAMRVTIVVFTGAGAGLCDRDEGHVDLRPGVGAPTR